MRRGASRQVRRSGPPPVGRALLAAAFLLISAIPQAGAEIVNSVAATGWRNGEPVLSTPARATVGVVRAMPALALEVRPVSRAFSEAGQPVDFDVEVVNAGNVTLRSVAVSAPGGEPIACPAGGPAIAALVPGESAICRLRARAKESDVAAGSLTVQVSATGEDLGARKAGPVTASATVAGTRADLVTVKTIVSGTDRPLEGSMVVFRVEVTNNGPETATGVEVTDRLPEGLIYRTDTAAGAYDPGTGVWKIGAIRPGGVSVLEITAEVDRGIAGSTLVNRAAVTALDQNDGREAGDRGSASLVVPAADLETRKTLRTQGPFREGDTVEFRITVRNRGPDRATAVSLTDALPEGLVSAGRVFAASQGGYDARTGLWLIGTLEAGAEASIVLETRIEAGQAGRRIVNRARAARSADVGDPSMHGDELAAEIAVELPVLVARDDSAGGVNGVRGATAVLGVLDNDLVDGRPADPRRLVVSVPGEGGPLSVDTAGILAVAPGTPAGLHEVGYRVCVAILPDICASANARVEVVAPAIRAVDDEAPDAANGTAGSPGFLDILANDTLDGERIEVEMVAIEVLGQGPGAYLAIDGKGKIGVPPGTPAGTYALDYRICDRINRDNCDSATATVKVDAPASITGTLFRDANGSGVYEADADLAGGDLVVELVQGGNGILRAEADPEGRYRIAGAQAGTDYRIVARHANGSIAGGIANVDLLPGQDLTEQDLPLGPTGLVYDAITRRPVAGAILRLTDAAGVPLPAPCLIDPSRQGQVTGADGGYRFDLAPGASGACPAEQTLYRLSVMPPEGYVQGISTILPPLAEEADVSTCDFDPVPGGSCQASASPDAPAIGSPAIHALALLVEAGERLPLHNHIPVDPAPAQTRISLAMNTGRPALLQGERVVIAIEARNLGTSPLDRLTLENVVPAGFRFAEGSATVDGARVSPEGEGASLRIGDLVLEPGGRRVVNLAIEAGPATAPGRYFNRARLLDAEGNPVAAEAQAAIDILPDAGPGCSDIVGSVFDDESRNGIADSGERGLPGVGIIADGAALATTDGFGRFRIACADIPGAAPGTAVEVAIDPGTLPPGYRIVDGEGRFVRLTPEATVNADFAAVAGRIVRLDINAGAFEAGSTELKARWIEGIARLVQLLQEEFSVLRLAYRLGDGDEGLARQRLDSVVVLIRERWVAAGDPYRLDIRDEIVR